MGQTSEVGHGAVGAAHVVWSELQLSLEELPPCAIADLGRLLGWIPRCQ